MGRHGADPAIRLQRAAGHLRGSVTFLETIADEEGIVVPVEVVRAANTIRAWTRQLGAPEETRPTLDEFRSTIPGRPRPRHPMRRSRR